MNKIKKVPSTKYNCTSKRQDFRGLLIEYDTKCGMGSTEQIRNPLRLVSVEFSTVCKVGVSCQSKYGVVE